VVCPRARSLPMHERDGPQLRDHAANEWPARQELPQGRMALAKIPRVDSGVGVDGRTDVRNWYRSGGDPCESQGKSSGWPVRIVTCGKHVDNGKSNDLLISLEMRPWDPAEPSPEESQLGGRLLGLGRHPHFPPCN
jgi:hypothetical protein